jgi:hypothetical protein
LLTRQRALRRQVLTHFQRSKECALVVVEREILDADEAPAQFDPELRM